MTIFECAEQPAWNACLAIAWFIQMGVHEGMHAEVAFRRGDDTASLLGKRTFLPFAHIDPSIFGVLASVVLPIYTAFVWGIPLGMAWVPINPLRLRNRYRDHALVAVAGPAGNVGLCALCLLVHFTVLRWVPPSHTVASIETLFAAVYWTSAIYGVFNLIPFPPLDGSVVLYWLSPGSVRDMIDRVRPWGFLALILIFRLVPGVSMTFALVIGAAGALYA